MSRQVCFLSLGSECCACSWEHPLTHTGQASSKVNYGHSLHGGISLAVIAHSIPLPCASLFLSQIYAALIHEGAASAPLHMLPMGTRWTEGKEGVTQLQALRVGACAHTYQGWAFWVLKKQHMGMDGAFLCRLQEIQGLLKGSVFVV